MGRNSSINWIIESVTWQKRERERDVKREREINIGWDDHEEGENIEYV